ncbi:MAG TPA: hypothetical protein PLR99_26165, partial [Polyangiaceae bacterium]|nr:hypothetical protein [Polyangiaceae bacterium]
MKRLGVWFVGLASAGCLVLSGCAGTDEATGASGASVVGAGAGGAGGAGGAPRGLELDCVPLHPGFGPRPPHPGAAPPPGAPPPGGPGVPSMPMAG